MRTISYKPENVCSRLITVTVTDDNIITEIVFTGGCPGNTLGISKLVQGMSIDDVIRILKGTKCPVSKNNGQTSCPDQLTKALEQLKL